MNTETISYLDDVIDEAVIASCVSPRTCEPALNWLQERPRTYRDLRKRSKGWYCWLAEYVTIPSVLAKLAGDANAAVRYQVARNVNTPVAALESLAGDADADVRFHVAWNRNTTIAVLERLDRDADASVRRVAKSRLASIAAVRLGAKSLLVQLLERRSHEDGNVGLPG